MNEVKDALDKLKVSGLTVTEVRGFGKQKGHATLYRGEEYNISLLPKMAVEVVVSAGMTNAVVQAIIEVARTGQIGDGRIFVTPVERCYRIRTGELED